MNDETTVEASSVWGERLPLVSLVVVAVLAAAMAGFVVGSRDDRPSPSSVDVGFLYDMIAHHEQAVLLAKLEIAQGGDPTVLTFAREVVQTQSFELGLMTRRLLEFGYSPDAFPDTAMGWMGHAVPVDEMPGMASDAEIEALGERMGADADAMFLALMTDHHAGGVHMAEQAARRAGDAWLRDLAARIARNQRVEIREYEQARLRAGLAAEPPGFDKDVDLPPPGVTSG